METGILVFARLDSRRLPGKALLPLAGRPMLARVLDRLKRVRNAGLVVATSERSVDDPIAVLAAEENVTCYRGSVDDVLGRCAACAKELSLDRIVRISGDSPFISPELVQQMLDLQTRIGADVVTNVYPRSFPPGQSVEVLTRTTLETGEVEATTLEDREHVTPWFYRNSGRFHILNHRSPDVGWADLRLVVDDAADRERAQVLISRLGSAPEYAPLEKVIAVARLG